MVGVEMNGDADPGDILHRMPRKMTGPGADTRSRKISHRKVIIHDDGEICNKTYNKVLAHLLTASCSTPAVLQLVA